MKGGSWGRFVKYGLDVGRTPQSVIQWCQPYIVLSSLVTVASSTGPCTGQSDQFQSCSGHVP